MLKAIANNILQAAATLIAIMTLSFFVIELAPGGPLSQKHRMPAAVRVGQYIHQGIGIPVYTVKTCKVKHVTQTGKYLKTGAPLIFCEDYIMKSPSSGRLLAINASPGETISSNRLIAAIGKPIGERYLNMLANMAVFNFGFSYKSAGIRTVREIITGAAPITAVIGLVALLLALVFGFLSGIFAAWNFWADYSLTSLSTLLLAIPVIVAAPMTLYIFAVSTHLLPVGWDGTIAGAILPIITLASIYWAVFHRVVLTSARDFFDSSVFNSLRAKGLRTPILALHTIRHITLGISGLLGPIAASLLTGSVVVEEVFHVPGLARFFVSSALGRDFPVLMGVVYVYALLLVLFNMGSDLLVFVLDPRTRRSL